MPTLDPKRIAAEKAVEYAQDGMILGLGTGSTAYWAIQTIAQKVRDGMKIQAVASSEGSANLARELKIPIISFSKINAIDITIDGADEVDKNHNLIKGGGGALLREKILAIHTRKYLIVVDESKMVNQLGAFPLPVEILPFASNLTLKKIRELQCQPAMRLINGKEFITDNGNFIVDCHFGTISDPKNLNLQLHTIPGVVETGLFVGMNPTVIVGYLDGKVETF